MNPDDIAAIRLHVGDYHDLMCQPLDERRAPATLADAKFSLPFLVSVAIVRRGMSVTDFSAAGLARSRGAGVGRKMRPAQRSGAGLETGASPGRVEITARDGRTWLREGSGVPGNTDNPHDVGRCVREIS